MPVLDDNWFIMGGLLDESRFFPLDAPDSYETGLEKMIRALTDAGQLDEGFAERLREREKLGNMAFDHGVAIPHTVQYAGNRLVLAIGTFPKAVSYGGQDIRVIFLMGVPEAVDADDGMLVRVYEEIISVAQEPPLLEKVANAKDFQSLLRALYRQA